MYDKIKNEKQKKLDLIATIMINLDNNNKLVSQKTREKLKPAIYLSAISNLEIYESYLKNNIPISNDLIELIEKSIQNNNKNLY
jgi:hypothetical protein